jgi:cytochrome c
MRRLFLLVVLSGLTPQFAAAQEDAVQRGEAAFRMCGACHSVGEDAVNRMGPELNDVMAYRSPPGPGSPIRSPSAS